jgi:hypothetical protein
MDTTTLDFSTLTLVVAILASTMGSTLTLVTMMIRQANRHEDSIKALDTKFTDSIKALDTKFTDSIKALDTKFTDSIKALDTKIDTRFDAMGRDVSDARERLARIEGHLTAPGDFRARGPHPPAPDDLPDDPATGQRAAI